MNYAECLTPNTFDFDTLHRKLILPTFLFMLSLSVVLMGCSFASFTAAAEADVPVVLQMVENIVNFIAPGISPDIALAGSLAISGLEVLCGMPAPGASKCDPASLIGQYQANPTTGLLAKIQAVLATVNSHIQTMLALAKALPATIGSAIVTAVGVALSTVTLLLSLVGVKTVEGAKSALKVLPSAKKVKNDFNKAIAKQFPRAVIK